MYDHWSVYVERRMRPERRKVITWSRTLKGRQDVKDVLPTIDLMKSGQLSCVKFLPIPPSNAVGKGESVDVGAVMISEPTSVDVASEVSVADPLDSDLDLLVGVPLAEVGDSISELSDDLSSLDARR